MFNQDQAPSVSRAAEITRAALIKAATAVFSEHGFEGGSVRLITQKASANQAAINYHFGGKEGLYREVLIAAADALDQHSFLSAEELDAITPEQALRRYLRQFLLPLVKRDRISCCLRIFAWESVRPSAVFQTFIKTKPPRIFLLAERVIRRFLPENTSAQDVGFATLWLAQQPLFFVKNAEKLARPPFSMKFDEGLLEQLVDRLARLSLGGLRGF